MASRTRNSSIGRRRPTLPDPFYYLNNFRSVLALLQKRYGERELLSAEERQFITQFATLPEPSCALLVRMIMRRGMLFRLSRLRYPEIGDTAAAAEPLLTVGWLEEPLLDVTALHRLEVRRTQDARRVAGRSPDQIPPQSNEPRGINQTLRRKNTVNPLSSANAIPAGLWRASV